MNSVFLVFLGLVVCTALIGFSGVHLIRYAEAVADATGLSSGWIGMVFVATVTSLPELATGLGAVTYSNAPDIAAGDVLGSCVLNLMLLGVMDVMYRKSPMFSIVSSAHVISAASGFLLLSLTALLLVMGRQQWLLSMGHVSLGSVLLIGLYAWTIHRVYRAEQHSQVRASLADGAMPIKTAVMGYAFAAMAIVVGAIGLLHASVALAQLMGWSDSFVGTLLVAFATSVPELVITLGALRVGAVDMAVGNLLGSNLFDVLILALDDLAYVRGALYEHVSIQHVVSAMVSALMSAVVWGALVFRPPEHGVRSSRWVGPVLLVFYGLNVAFQFLYRH